MTYCGQWHKNESDVCLFQMEALTRGRGDQMGLNHTDLAAIGKSGIVGTTEWRINSHSQSNENGQLHIRIFFWPRSTCSVEKPASVKFFQSRPESSQETLALCCSQIFWVQCAICDLLFGSKSLWQWQGTKKQLFQQCTLEAFLPPYSIAEPNCKAVCSGQGHLNQILTVAVNTNAPSHCYGSF